MDQLRQVGRSVWLLFNRTV